MSLVPLSGEEVGTLLAVRGTPTGAQYSTYFGRTERERYARCFESATVGFLGVFFSYFLSFVLGGFVATVSGCLFLFWGVLSPEFKAVQRNWEFLGGRPLADTFEGDDQYYGVEYDDGLHGALFLGRLEDVAVVQDASDPARDEYDLSEFADYRMETDELERYTGQPYLLRVRCAEADGGGGGDDDADDEVLPPPPRTLQVHARLSEEYLDLEVGMPVLAVLLSTSPRFDKLAALSDLFVPDAGCWIGDYPYLARAEVEEFLADNPDVWDALVAEGTWDGDGDGGGDDDDDEDLLDDGGDYDDDDDDLWVDDADDDDTVGGSGWTATSGGGDFDGGEADDGYAVGDDPLVPARRRKRRGRY